MTTLAEAIEKVRATGTPLRIRADGEVQAVLMTPETFERLRNALAQVESASARLAPVAAKEDPDTSRTAERLIRGARRTRKASVLAVLQESVGTWVDGWVLTQPDVGGSEGLRRLRELEADGIHIEKRPHPDAGLATWQYRLPDYAPIAW